MSDAWKSALTVVQEVTPPFIPQGAHAMTVVIDLVLVDDEELEQRKDRRKGK